MTEKAPGFVERFKAKVRNGMDRLKDRFKVFMVESGAELQVVGAPVVGAVAEVVGGARSAWREQEGRGLRKLAHVVAEGARNLGGRVSNLVDRAKHAVAERGIIGAPAAMVGNAIGAVADLMSGDVMARFQNAKMDALADAADVLPEGQAATGNPVFDLLEKTYNHVDDRRTMFQKRAEAHRRGVTKIENGIGALRRLMLGRKQALSFA